MTVATGLEREYARGASTMTAWESELASFMNDLSSVQNETLEVLAQKRKCLASIDVAGLDALAGREDELMNRLQDCLKRRAELLEKADQEGLPAGSIGDLAKTLSSGKPGDLSEQVKQASARTRLLRHHSLTNWVLVQRTLLHLSQMLEIIATGGKKRPTYSKDEIAESGGALVDRVA